MIKEVRDRVKDLVGDSPTYGIGRIDRVTEMSEKFAKQLMKAETYRDKLREVQLTAILSIVDGPGIYAPHDDTCYTTLSILDTFGASDYLKETVTDNLCCIGYLNRLAGAMPASLPAMIVSDVLMLDEMGVNGIMAAVDYAKAYAPENGKNFIQKGIYPRMTITYDDYLKNPPASAINLLFERQLHMRSMMMTRPGFEEASKRSLTVINFLRSYFRENNLFKWDKFLSEYLREIYEKEGC